MVEGDKRKDEEKSELVATVITDISGAIKRTTLITPNATYEMSDGRLNNIEDIDYISSVEKHFDALRERAKTRFFSGEYRIQVIGGTKNPN